MLNRGDPQHPHGRWLAGVVRRRDLFGVDRAPGRRRAAAWLHIASCWWGGPTARSSAQRSRSDGRRLAPRVERCAVDAEVSLPPDQFVGLSGYYGWPGADVPAEVVNPGTIRWFGAIPERRPRRLAGGEPVVVAHGRAITGPRDSPLVSVAVGHQRPASGRRTRVLVGARGPRLCSIARRDRARLAPRPRAAACRGRRRRAGRGRRRDRARGAVSDAIILRSSASGPLPRLGYLLPHQPTLHPCCSSSKRASRPLEGRGGSRVRRTPSRKGAREQA